MALYCDIRFASEKATFTTAFARRGLIAEHGISWILPRTVGMTNALDLLFSAETLETAVALHERMGKTPAVIRQYVPGFIVNRLAHDAPASRFPVNRPVFCPLFPVDRQPVALLTITPGNGSPSW